MVKKVTLEPRAEPVPVTLFGVSCHLKDYRLSYHLNQVLSLGLAKQNDFRGNSLYLYRDDDNFHTYYLLGNRGESTILLPDLKQTDFLLLLEGPVKRNLKEQMLAKIKGVQSVLAVYEVRNETVKNYRLMLNDLELHMIDIQKESKINYSPVKNQEEPNHVRGIKKNN